jgi:hypothetical protein
MDTVANLFAAERKTDVHRLVAFWTGASLHAHDPL